MKYEQIKKIGVEGFQKNLPPQFFLFAYKRKKCWKWLKIFGAIILACNFAPFPPPPPKSFFLFAQFDNVVSMYLKFLFFKEVIKIKI